MERVAAGLGRRAGRTYPQIGRWARAGLWLVTDPARTPDPLAALARLPRGTVAIYRSFGAANSLAEASAMARFARKRGVILLVGADPRLARRSGAHGLHLPERLAHQAGTWRRRRPQWLVTAAAHSLPAARRAQAAGAQAVLVSAVFPSRSPSAPQPLGPIRFEALARGLAAPVIALGGIGPRTARRLAHSRAAGLAGVGAFVSEK